MVFFGAVKYMMVVYKYDGNVLTLCEAGIRKELFKMRTPRM